MAFNYYGIPEIYNILEIIYADNLMLWGKIIEIMKWIPEIYSI